MIASVAVVMTIFPALFAAVLVLGSHVAALAVSPPRLLGSRLLASLARPLLFSAWLWAIALLFLVSLSFGFVGLFVTLNPAR